MSGALSEGRFLGELQEFFGDYSRLVFARGLPAWASFDEGAASQIRLQVAPL
jgi:hypothetical protein